MSVAGFSFAITQDKAVQFDYFAYKYKISELEFDHMASALITNKPFIDKGDYSYMIFPIQDNGNSKIEETLSKLITYRIVTQKLSSVCHLNQPCGGIVEQSSNTGSNYKLKLHNKNVILATIHNNAEDNENLRLNIQFQDDTEVSRSTPIFHNSIKIDTQLPMNQTSAKFMVIIKAKHDNYLPIRVLILNIKTI
jgi:hypothetical protein